MTMDMYLYQMDAHLYTNNDTPPEPTDRQLDYIDIEYHLIKKKKSTLSASKRRKIVETWNRYKGRMGYIENV